MKDEKLLQLNNIHVNYGGVKALDGASVTLDEGEMIALMGPNGAGKSTILKSIFGLAPIASGEVLWHEKEITPRPHELVPLGISFVPQGRRTFNDLTVYENLEVGAYTVKNPQIVKNRIEQVLEIFPDLKKKLKAKSGSLSGGQQQMVAIARGLMTDPKVLLLDEPTLGLAPKVVNEMFAKIKEINVKRKVAVMVVEHNIQTLLPLCDRAYLMDKGKIIVDDAPDAILNSDILENVFMGKVE